MAGPKRRVADRPEKRRGALQRVGLRTVRDRDIAALAGWLPSVASKVGCERWIDTSALSNPRGAEQFLTNSDKTLFLAYEIEAPNRGAATVLFLAVESASRRVGLGGRAVLELEKRLKPTCQRVAVAVPSRIGIALYFWLRLGYRPSTAVHQLRQARVDATHMLRDLA